MNLILHEEMIGSILMIGSLAFLTAAFMPVSRVFGVRDKEQKLAIIQAERSGWTFSQSLFALGAAITWLGLGLLAIRILYANGSVIPLVSTAVAGVGLIFWLWHVYLRAAKPEDFVNNLLPGWHFLLYGFFTLLGLIGISLGMPALKFPVWLPVANISSAVLFTLLFLIFKDLPPALFYLVTLVNGIALLIFKPF